MGWLTDRRLPILVAALTSILLIYWLSTAIGPSATGLAGAGGGYHTMAGNADLKILSVSYSPSGPQTGDSVNFSVTVKNIGSESTGASFKLALYIDDTNVANGTMTNLPDGVTNMTNITWTAQSELHDVYVLADPDNTTGGDKGHNRINGSIAVDWPTAQQNNERQGHANTPGPGTNHTTWIAKLTGELPSDNYYNMLVADGMVITSTTGYIYAVNATTGAKLWNVTWSYYEARSMTAAAGRLFVAESIDAPDGTFNISAYNLSNGQKLWYASQRRPPYFVAYYGGLVLHDNESMIIAREPSTGNEVWNYTPPNLTGWAYFAWRLPAIYNDTIYMVSLEDILGDVGGAYSFDLVNHSMNWNRTAGIGGVYATPSVGYGNLYFADYNGTNFTNTIRAVNASTGEISWSIAGLNTVSSITFPYFDNAVYSEEFGGIYAHNPTNGTPIWSKSVSGNSLTGAAGPVTANNGIAYFALSPQTEKTGIYAINVSDGSILWAYRFPSGDSNYIASLALYNERLYAMSNKGKIFAFWNGPNVTVLQSFNDTAVDRDSVSDSMADSVLLTANLSDGASDVTFDFCVQEVEPITGDSDCFDSNDSVNGNVLYDWDPDASYPAGRYIWWVEQAYDDIYITQGTSAVRVYGGMNASFRYADTYPASNYSGTDNVVTDAFVGFPGGEDLDTMKNNYSFRYNFTLTKPNGDKIMSGLYNTTSAPLGFWNGTATLTGEGGTWTATLNATADFFITNDTTNRTFTVTGTTPPPSGGPGGSGTGGSIGSATFEQQPAYQVSNYRPEYGMDEMIGFDYKVINPSSSTVNATAVTTITGPDGKAFWTNAETVYVASNGTYPWKKDVDRVRCSLATGTYSVKVAWVRGGRTEKTDVLAFNVLPGCVAAKISATANKLSYSTNEVARLTIRIENTGNVVLKDANVTGTLSGLNMRQDFSDIIDLMPNETITITKDIPLKGFAYGHYTYKTSISYQGRTLASDSAIFIVLTVSQLFIPATVLGLMLIIIWRRRKPVSLKKRLVRTAHGTKVNFSLANRTKHAYKNVIVRDRIPARITVTNMSPQPSVKKRLENGSTMLEWHTTLMPKQRVAFKYELNKKKRLLPKAKLHYRRDRDTEKRLKTAKKAHGKK